jgi:hypothetical protein
VSRLLEPTGSASDEVRIVEGDGHRLSRRNSDFPDHDQPRRQRWPL